MSLELELSDDQLEAIAEGVAELVAAREERWKTQKQLADHFGCSVRTVLNWQKAGMPHLMVGSHPRYRVSECEGWLRGYDGRAMLDAATNGPAPLPRPGPGHRRASSHAKQEA